MKKVVSIIAVLAIATAAQAAVVATHDGGTATPGLSGFTTYEVTLTSDSGDLTGFEVEVNTEAGSVLNHVFMGSSIFQDLNIAIPVPAQDSQFNFLTSAITGDGAARAESATQLRAIFALAGGTGSPDAAAAINLLHITMPDGDSAIFSGLVTVGVVEATFASITIPEPASLALLGMGGISMLIRRRR